jgi:Chromo (CHRromatin Organisation MOdifier) domain
VVSPYVYKLDLPPQWKIHNVFHASLLTPYSETAEHGQNFTEPPPDLVDDHPEYEVEEILGSRRRYRKLQYLLKWKGYSAAHNTWEPVENVNSPELIREFYEANPEAVRTLEVKEDIRPPLDPQSPSSPSLMDFSPVRDFILDLDLASVDIPDDVYAALLLAGLTPEDFQPKHLDIDNEYATSPSPLPVPDPSTRPLAPVPILRAPQPARLVPLGGWSPGPTDDDYPSPVAPPNSEEEPFTLALDAFNRVDEWRAQSAPHLAAAGQEVETVQTPSSYSDPGDAFGRDRTRVSSPTAETAAEGGYRLDQSFTASYYREESQLPRQDSYSGYPSPTSPHASVPLDAGYTQPARGYVAQPLQLAVYTPTEPDASAAKGKAPADRGSGGLRRMDAGVWNGVCAPQHAPSPYGAWYQAQQFSPSVTYTWVPVFPPAPAPPVVYPTCRHCGALRPDYPFDLCPTDVRCLYCGGGHLGSNCPWPHLLCTAADCFCPDDHAFAKPEGVRHPVWQCPTSGTMRRRH